MVINRKQAKLVPSSPTEALEQFRQPAEKVRPALRGNGQQILQKPFLDILPQIDIFFELPYCNLPDLDYNIVVR